MSCLFGIRAPTLNTKTRARFLVKGRHTLPCLCWNCIGLLGVHCSLSSLLHINHRLSVWIFVYSVSAWLVITTTAVLIASDNYSALAGCAKTAVGSDFG